MAEIFVSGLARGTGSGNNSDNPKAWSSIGSIITSATNGDVIVLEAGLLNGSKISYIQPTTFNWTKRLTLEARFKNGDPGFAIIEGVRTNPWPASGLASPGVDEGKPFCTGKVGMNNTVFRRIVFKNVKYVLNCSCASPNDVFTVTFEDCQAKNYTGWGYTSSDTKGRMNIIFTGRNRGGGFTVCGATRTWGSVKIGVENSQQFCYFDGQNQFATNTETPSVVNMKDFLPDNENSLRTLELYGVGMRNVSPPSTAGYVQSDLVVAEESAGKNGVKIKDVYCDGTSDRGLDLKGGGIVERALIKNAGYGVGAHACGRNVEVSKSTALTPRRRDNNVDPVAAFQAAGNMVVKESVVILTPSLSVNRSPSNLSLYLWTKASYNGPGSQARLLTPPRFGSMTIYDSSIIYDANLTEITKQGAGFDDGTVVVVGGLTPNTSYDAIDWTLAAFDQYGNIGPSIALITGGSQNPLPVTIGLPLDTTPPSAPSNLVASNITNTSVELTWTASIDGQTDVFGYIVMIKVGDTECYSSMTEETTIKLNNLKPGTSYDLTVRAYDYSNNISSSSNMVTVMTTGSGGTSAIPSIPRNFHVNVYSGAPVSSHNTLQFTWQAPTTGTVAGYLLYYKNKAVARTCVGVNTLPKITQTQVRSFKFKGEYLIDTSYSIDDVVISGSDRFRSLTNSNVNHTPTDGSSYWKKLYC